MLLTTDLPPEPFFGGPGLDRADALRADDAALHGLTQRHDARELQWQDGLPVLSQDGRLMWGSPSSPELFLGLDDGSPRYSAIQPVVPDAPSAFGAMALLDRDDAPVFAAALSLLYFAAVGVALLNDVLRRRREPDYSGLSDDEASPLEYDLAPVEAPEPVGGPAPLDERYDRTESEPVSRRDRYDDAT